MTDWKPVTYDEALDIIYPRRKTSERNLVVMAESTELICAPDLAMVRIVDLRPWWRQRAFWRGFAYGASLWPLLARYTLRAWCWLARRTR